ncbi:MAG: hypothetical protein A2X61_08790 [Ignavibacteria bacterium GWB2_35_12]|nr:MAG: hypothetical protein A2X61_08790 [Ignavibacteria bacterium GWB2_35_12]OGU91655.1 MAG: hypothetical protein A2220_10440 [Ignavibacteria bacterium RIFOXYA2_FULL_35_10]OGV22625.1 MAG: hypothetical protein A2475_12985 [Ignavibacteria bacterium RIFOXYC2_FULL_35_21]
MNEIKYFNTGIIRGIGRANVLITLQINESQSFVSGEYLVFFEFIDDSTIFINQKYNPTLNKDFNSDLFIEEIKLNCHIDIFRKIIHTYLQKYSIVANNYEGFLLNETDESLITYLKYKYPNALIDILKNTINKKLISLIQLNQKIYIEPILG